MLVWRVIEGFLNMKIRVFDVDFNVICMSEAVDEIISRTVSLGGACDYVVTPNVDHIITLKNNSSFRAAYHEAFLRVIDGWPVAKAIQFISGVSAKTIPGSDLVPSLFDRLEYQGRMSKIYLLGALPGVAQRAASIIKKRWPTLVIVGTYSPPFGFEKDPVESDRICDMLRAAKPDIIIMGVGAPKQEIWIHRNRDKIGPCVAICAGATIDFIAGAKRRAPKWMRKSHLEWLYRVMQEPKRLFKRYLKGGFVFPYYVLREALASHVKDKQGKSMM